MTVPLQNLVQSWVTCGFEERIRVQKPAAAVTWVNEAIRATGMIVHHVVASALLRCAGLGQVRS